MLFEEQEIVVEKTFRTGYTRQDVRAAIPREEGMKPGQILPVKMVEFLNNETIVGEIVR